MKSSLTTGRQFSGSLVEVEDLSEGIAKDRKGSQRIAYRMT